MKKDPPGTLYCSFCGKSQYEVFYLIAGPTVFICSECVDFWSGLVQQERERRANPIVPKGATLTCPKGHVWTDETVRIIKPRHETERPIVACRICFDDLVMEQLGQFGALFDVTGEHRDKGWPLGKIVLPAQAGEA